MVDHHRNSLEDVIKQVGQFAPDAFHFVREGLGHAAQRVHGPENDAYRSLQQFIIANELEWTDLIERYDAGALPDTIAQAIDEAGGCDKLDRHVSGRELCWGLRDYALDRWGMLARTVLESWRVRATADFGRIVFGFIDGDMMQKQPGDNLNDFDEVYSFDEAFDIEFGRHGDAPKSNDHEPCTDS